MKRKEGKGLRKAIYHSTRDFRVVSRPGGAWVAQKRGPGESSKTHDVWFDMQGETTKEQAEGYMTLCADGFGGR